MAMGVFWFLSLVLATMAAQDPSLFGVFLNPLDSGPETDYVSNPVYSLGQVLNVTWVTKLPSYTVFVWQQNLAAHSALKSSSIYCQYKPLLPRKQN